MNYYLALLSKHRTSIMGFAIIWVMMFHLAYRPEIPIIKDFINYGYGGVDIFLFLSGFGLFFSMSKENTNLTTYYKKRFSRIFPIFWFFLIVTFLYSKNFSSASFTDLAIRATTLGYWIPGGSYTLWYISCIVLLYVIYPIYHKLLVKKGLKISLIFIFIGLIATAIYGFIMVHFYNNINVGNMLILSISRIPIFFIGTIFGYWAKYKTEHILSNNKCALIVSIFWISVLALIYFNANLPEYCGTCSLFFLPFIFITPILCVFLSIFFEKVQESIKSVFTFIGTMSLELYIVHEFLYIQEIYALAGKFSDNIVILLGVPISFVFAIILHQINKRILLPSFNKLLF